jgi:hypothetical protein
MMSVGHRWTLVIASHVKWVLRGELSPQWRLEFLGHLEKMTDSILTPAIIAMVDPIDEKGLEIVEEARKLGYGPLPPNMFTVLDQKFEVFAALNPSLQAAYDEACRPWMKASA